MQPAFPWHLQVPNPAACEAGFSPSWSHVLALALLFLWPCPSKAIMWLWWVLIGSDCSSGRITCLSPASTTISWSPNNTHAWSLAFGQQTRALASSNSITSRNHQQQLEQVPVQLVYFLQGTFWADPAALESSPGEAVHLGTHITPLPTDH